MTRGGGERRGRTPGSSVRRIRMIVPSSWASERTCRRRRRMLPAPRSDDRALNFALCGQIPIATSAEEQLTGAHLLRRGLNAPNVSLCVRRTVFLYTYERLRVYLMSLLYCPPASCCSRAMAAWSSLGSTFPSPSVPPLPLGLTPGFKAPAWPIAPAWLIVPALTRMLTPSPVAWVAICAA